jgi:hypothetical protein
VLPSSILARQFVRTLTWAQVPLVVGVGLPFVVGIFLLLALGGGMDARVFEFRVFLAAKTYVYALVTVLLYGAPVYAYLAQRGWANWLTAALIGIAPGVGAFLIGTYPSGRLTDANFTVGPMVIACGLFIALMTHTLVHGRGLQPTSQARALSYVLMIGAVLGTWWTYIATSNASRAGASFAGLGLVYGTVTHVAPFALAACACALYSYLKTAKPRGALRVVEIVLLVIIAAFLSAPAAYLVVILRS